MISTWKVKEIDYSEGNSQRSEDLIWPFNNGKEQKKELWIHREDCPMEELPRQRQENRQSHQTPQRLTSGFSKEENPENYTDLCLEES